jgi:hypothetical protein
MQKHGEKAGEIPGKGIAGPESHLMRRLTLWAGRRRRDRIAMWKARAGGGLRVETGIASLSASYE